ncbi:MAG: U32 family peptidase [Clostridia bacterium]|nr:U32 family peptidase [Clostridia bacterium]
MLKENFAMEVLAPVGNTEMLYAAVRSGANAVYLGAKSFNARRNADNFEIYDLKEAVEYCHIRGVKVYLTLNILISDGEMKDAVGLAADAYNIGIDGVIIADLGLARILREKLPLLPLHASTQMTVCHKDSLYFLKELGFSRVVAAREMSKAELNELCATAKELNIEVEVFVHGALCMCLSGQCLLSALLGGRSGNRGLCAGPCRLPFSDRKGNDYVLSLKDLSLLQHIDELSKMGVTSLKIEGRMKRSEYVAAAVSAFRSMVDTGSVPEEYEKCLKDVFSRSGFTDGYFTEKRSKEMFGIRTKEDAGDAKGAYPFLHELIRHERQSVGISISAVIKENEPVTLTLCDNENTVTVTGELPEKAINRPLTKEAAAQNLSKLGSTPYFAEKQEIIIDDGITVRASALNEMRRKACELLSLKRAEIKRERVTVCLSAQYLNPPKTEKELWVRVNSPCLLPDDLSGISAVLLPIEADHDLLRLYGKVLLIAELPRAGLYGNELKEKLEKAKKSGFTAALVQNSAQLKAVTDVGLTPIGGNGLNVFSSHTLSTLKSFGINTAVLSPELRAEQINRLNSEVKTVLFAYGRLPLMITRNCPAALSGCKDCKGDRVITDRMGISFPVKCRSGYSELFCDRPIWLGDRTDEFNVDALLLYFTFEEGNETERVIKAYKNGEKNSGEYTRGMYYRGVE